MIGFGATDFVLTGRLSYASKTDYACNGGKNTHTEIGAGPGSLKAAETYDWPEKSPYASATDFNGICFTRSEINFRQIEDGTTNTYMIGEKWMHVEHYETGLDRGDNEPAFTGNNTDTIRLTHTKFPLVSDSTLYSGDLKNQDHLKFGSPHPGGFNMAMCDASVQFVTLDVDPEIHAWAGARNDGDQTVKTTFTTR